MANAILFKRDYTRPKVTGNGHSAVAIGEFTQILTKLYLTRQRR